MTEQMINAPYKYTIPIEKAFIGEDGRPRLVGAATGPEVDLENQRVSKSLIEKWVNQINTGQIEVIYDDWHKKDSVVSDLGTIEKAWTDDKGYMWVQVLLDDDNPVSQYIHKAARKGKQYGMSISGKATRFVDEVVSGRMIRTITDGTLERIAHTTRPIWTPSFGTVLSKAVDTAVAESAKGDTSVSEENKTETPQEAKPITDATAPDKPEVTEDTLTPDVSAETADSADTDAETTVEKAITASTKKDEKRLDKIVKLYNDLGSELREAGFLSEETKGEESATETVEKAETATDGDDRVVRLEKAFTDLATLVTKIADNTPDGTAPGVLRKSEEADPLAELKAIEDPMERFRLAVAAQHGDTPTLR